MTTDIQEPYRNLSLVVRKKKSVMLNYKNIFFLYSSQHLCYLYATQSIPCAIHIQVYIVKFKCCQSTILKQKALEQIRKARSKENIYSIFWFLSCCFHVNQKIDSIIV